MASVTLSEYARIYRTDWHDIQAKKMTLLKKGFVLPKALLIINRNKTRLTFYDKEELDKFFFSDADIKNQLISAISAQRLGGVNTAKLIFFR